MILIRLFFFVFIVHGVVTKETTSTSARAVVTSSKGTDKSEVSTSSSSSEQTGQYEDNNDRGILKFLMTIPKDDTYYNVQLKIDEQLLGVRVDITQPEVWVMDAEAFYDCGYLDEWWSSEEGTHTTLPKSATTEPEYSATFCGLDGLYSATSNLPAATVSGVTNGQYYRIPYLNSIEASGKFLTNDILFNTTNGQALSLKNFTFVNVNYTNLYVGGLGLVGNATGSGFLNSLVDQGYIKSPGYSLWFNNYSNLQDAMGELIPGAVDTKYFDGNFYAFDMLNYVNLTSPDGTEYDDRTHLRLPILALDDIEIADDSGMQRISLMSDNSSFPVLLDTRTTYNYLPLDVIIKLAIQTNALYSSGMNRWLVACDSIASLNASMDFTFGRLSVKVPLKNLMSDADWYSTSGLKFSNGEKACILNVLPNSLLGFNSLGLPFLTSTYLAVDNAGGKIAIGNTNGNLVVKKDDFSFSSVSKIPTTSKRSNSTSTKVKSIGYIESGTIPFATTINASSLLTLTFSSVNFSNPESLDVPSKFSGYINSGQIFVAPASQNLTQIFPQMASAATEKSTAKTKNFGNTLKNPLILNNNYNSNEILGLVFGISLFMIGISLL